MIDRFFSAAREQPAHIVLPEAEDERILAAAARLAEGGLARVTLLGGTTSIQRQAASMGLNLDGVELVEPEASDRLTFYSQLYRLGRPQASENMALRAARKPIYYGALMVKAGDADLLLAGAATPTRRVIEAARLCIGLAEGIGTPSSFFLVVPPGQKPLIFADCAVNVDPTSAELADIALASAGSAAKLLAAEPEVAMLSFSSHGSAQHPRVDFVQGAAKEVLRRVPHLKVEGDLQLDAALSESVATKKLKSPGPVAGQANVLVFPSLEAGNIGYKLTQYLGGAQALGPILQGFAKPVADLSRGASVDDIVSTTLATAAMVTEQTIATDGDV